MLADTFGIGREHARPARPPLSELNFNVDFLVDEPGYYLPPHTDHCAKLVSVLIYLPWNATDSQFGTAVYRTTPRAPVKRATCGEQKFTWEGYEEVKRITYEPNTLFAFSPCPVSWHGVPRR